MSDHSDLGFVPNHSDLGFVPDAKEGNGGASQAALEHFGNAAALGYLPQLQAMAEPITDRILNMAAQGMPGNRGGSVVEPAPLQQIVATGPKYLESRDANLSRMEKERKEHPAASFAGTLGGAIAGGTALASKLPLTAASKAGRMLQAGGQGAGLAFIANPGDVPGTADYTGQIGSRLKNALIGFPSGVAGQGVAEALSAGGKAGEKAAQEFASEKALQASGAMKKDFAEIRGRGRTNELGNVLLDNKMVTPLATTGKIAERLSEAKQAAGETVGNILDTAEAGGAPAINAKGIAEELAHDPEIQSLSKIPGKEGLAKQVASQLETLGRNGENLTLREAQALRQGIDDSITYSKKIPELRGNQPYLYKMRNAISRRMNDAVNTFDEMFGTPATNQLKEANRAYNQYTTLEEMASNRVAGLSANRMIGLTDTIAGGAGANAGAMIGHASGFPGGSKAGAIAGGLIGAAGNKAARTFGPSIMATGAHSIALPLAQVAEKLGSGLTQEAILPLYATEMIREQNPAASSSLGFVPDQKVGKKSAIQRRVSGKD